MARMLPETEVRLTAADVGDASLLTASGELDLYAADRLRDALALLVDRRPSKLVVDLTAVDFLDSTALGILVAAGKLVRAHGDTFLVVTADPRIIRLLEITGLTFLFDLRATLAEALDEHVASHG